MRSLYVASIVAALFLITALPGPARATGNVLVPSTQDDSSPSDDNTTNSDEDNGSSSDQSQPTPPQAAPKAAPIPGSADMSMPTGKNNMSVPASPKIPTSVSQIKQPSKDMTAAWGKNLPHALNIGFADSPTIGTRDTGTIKSRLGIPEDKIKDVCSLVLNGHVRTDKRTYMPAYNAFSSHFVVKYDGKIKTTWLNVMAACAKTALPANSGAIIQIGDKYVLALSQVSCPAPGDQSVKQLAISYAGDGKGQCVYQ